MRILFAENHAQFAATVIEQFLSAHVVIEVATIAEAITVARHERFDCALVDHDLDDGPGTELVTALVGLSFAGPIVATSAHDRGNAALRQAGATHVCKKFNFAQLPAMLDAIARALTSALTSSRLRTPPSREIASPGLVAPGRPPAPAAAATSTTRRTMTCALGSWSLRSHRVKRVRDAICDPRAVRRYRSSRRGSQTGSRSRRDPRSRWTARLGAITEGSSRSARALTSPSTLKLTLKSTRNPRPRSLS